MNKDLAKENEQLKIQKAKLKEQEIHGFVSFSQLPNFCSSWFYYFGN